MARQVKAIQDGISAAQAYEHEEQERSNAAGPLLAELEGLFAQVSNRNRELLVLNQSLEDKVTERTMELEKANEHLEALSLTDMLTGLPNRRHAMKWLEKLWEDAIRDDRSMCCMMIDADHFKEVNDTYGHDAGDVVLKELANTLKGAVRNDDVVCRLGGDEFFIICPETCFEGGMKVAHTVHGDVAKMKVSTGDGHWLGSISVGLASRAPEMKNFDELVKAADLGVYKAKEDGKNCVRTVSA